MVDIERINNIHIFAAYAFSYLHPCDIISYEIAKKEIKISDALLMYVPTYKLKLNTQSVDENDELVTNTVDTTVYALKHLEYLLVHLNNKYALEIIEICENYCKLLFEYYNEQYNIPLEELPEIYSSQIVLNENGLYIFKRNTTLPCGFYEYINNICKTHEKPSCYMEKHKDPCRAHECFAAPAAGGKKKGALPLASKLHRPSSPHRINNS